MSNFQAMLLDDMQDVFCNPDEFAEAVTYKPGGSGSRSISAVVRRDPVAGLPEAGQAVRPVIWLFVANDATTGISAAELDTGADLVSLPRRIGDTAEDFAVSRILGQDPGALWLELR